MTVKLTHVLRQRKEISTVDFQKTWREEFGPLVASLQARLSLARYVQLHRHVGDFDEGMRAARIATGICKPDELPFDVIEEYLFEITMAEFVEQLPSLQAAWRPLIDFESSHIDRAESHLFFVSELPQVLPGPEDLVLASPYNRNLRIHAMPEMADPETGFDHWVNVHGRLLRKLAPVLGLKKYIQNHPYQNARISKAIEDIRDERGMQTSGSCYSWYASAWIEDSVLERKDQTFLEANKAVDLDEMGGWMIKMSYMVSKEYIFVDKYRTA